MNRDALAILILFGVAAFLYSRQSQASYAPQGYAPAPASDSWAPTEWNPLEEITTIFEEVFTPVETPLPEPVTVDTPIEELPVFTNPIPNLPAI